MMNSLLTAIISVVSVTGVVIIVWLTPVTILLVLQHKRDKIKSLAPPLTADEENRQYEDIKSISANLKAETDNGFKTVLGMITKLVNDNQEKWTVSNSFSKSQTEELLRLSKDIANSRGAVTTNWENLNSFTKTQKNDLVKLVTNVDSATVQTSDRWKSLDSFTIKQREDITKLVKTAEDHKLLAATAKDELQKIVGLQLQTNNQFDKLEDLRNIFLNPNAKGLFAEKTCQSIIQNILGVNSPLLKMQKTFTVDKQIFRPDFVIQGSDRMKCIVIDTKCPTSDYSRMIKNNSAETKKAFRNSFHKIIKDFSKYVKKLADQIAIFCIYIPSDRMFLDIIENHDDEIFSKCTQAGIFLAAPSNLIYCLQLFDAMQRDITFSQNIEQVKSSIMLLKKKYDEFFTSYDQISKQIIKIYDRNRKLIKHKELLQREYSKIAFPVVTKSYSIIKRP